MRAYGPRRIVINEQARNVMPLSETSLNQMMEHGKTGMIIISGNRSEIDSSDPALSLRKEFDRHVEKLGGYGVIDSDALYGMEREWLAKRNKAADKQLKKDIMAAGFSFTPVFGGYHGKDSVVDSYEPSYVVYCYNRKGEPVDFETLKQFGLKECFKFKQESVYIQAPGQPPVYLDSDGNRMDKSSSLDFKLNRDGEEFFTTTSRDKTHPQRFTGDIQFESVCIPLRPGDYNERMRRLKQGEYIL